MKLYHIDRFCHVNENQTIELIKNIYTDVTENIYYKDGLSSHGLHYYLNDMDNKEHAMEAIFEYERLINYPNKLSRYQTIYAFDINGAIEFIKDKELNDNYFKIFEVKAKYYERYNMNLVRGWSNCMVSKYAKLYWSNGEDLVKDRKPIYEYLVKLPVKIGKEVLYKDLLKEYEKSNPKKEGSN